MSILHTVNKSPFQKNDFKSCIAHSSEGDAVLLIEDGVYGALANTEFSALATGAKAEIYCLGPDLAARGIAEDKLNKSVKLVDYEGFVDLAAEKDVVNSWL